ncbi:unnamed protein product [Orchesella dallaii]|uniref:Uncharacterized protein n=1 Tax=Orchesella dallaii TaxID=48710 RepID=A0ABP1RPW0_9HEXA
MNFKIALAIGVLLGVIAVVYSMPSSDIVIPELMVLPPPMNIFLERSCAETDDTCHQEEAARKAKNNGEWADRMDNWIHHLSPKHKLIWKEKFPHAAAEEASPLNIQVRREVYKAGQILDSASNHQFHSPREYLSTLGSSSNLEEKTTLKMNAKIAIAFGVLMVTLAVCQAKDLNATELYYPPLPYGLFASEVCYGEDAEACKQRNVARQASTDEKWVSEMGDWIQNLSPNQQAKWKSDYPEEASKYERLHG